MFQNNHHVISWNGKIVIQKKAIITHHILMKMIKNGKLSTWNMDIIYK